MVLQQDKAAGAPLHVFRAEVATQVAVKLKSRLHAVCRLKYNLNLLYCIQRVGLIFLFLYISTEYLLPVYISPRQLFESTCLGKNMYEIIVYNFSIYNLFL